MRLTDIQKKTIPFHKDKNISFYKGSVLNDQAKLIFQYSVSSQLFLGSYRLTLSYDTQETKSVCVFKVKPQEDGPLIQAENQHAQDIWDQKNHFRHLQTRQAIDLILTQHL